MGNAEYMGTIIMLSLMLTGFVFALFIVDSEAVNCQVCKCCDPNRGVPPYYMNWWARPTPQLPQYGNFGPQLPQYGNYGGLSGGRWEWGAAASNSHARPWNNILIGK